MRFYKKIEINLSVEMDKFMKRMFALGGNTRFLIQDVQEALHDTDPLRDEARYLREQHGNFWIEKEHG